MGGGSTLKREGCHGSTRDDGRPDELVAGRWRAGRAGEPGLRGLRSVMLLEIEADAAMATSLEKKADIVRELRGRGGSRERFYCVGGV